MQVASLLNDLGSIGGMNVQTASIVKFGNEQVMNLVVF